jgi:hypothetical protein
MTNGVNNEVYEKIIEDAPVTGLETPTEKTPVVGVPYGDLYLKFPDEATAFEALYKPAMKTVVTYDEEGTPTYTEEVVEGQFVPRYEGMSIDTIGIISVTDNTDLENPIVTELEGWHVNTRGPMNHILGAYSVEVPTNPQRVWA